MIRLQETVDVAWEPEETFSFLANFENLPRWDPGIVEARRQERGAELGVGVRFDVAASFLGQRVPMTYAITRWDAEGLVAELSGDAATLTAVDLIEVTPRDGGARVRWTAEFRMKGPLRLSEPVMRPLLERLGRKTMDGMRSRLSRPRAGVAA